VDDTEHHFVLLLPAVIGKLECTHTLVLDACIESCCVSWLHIWIDWH